MVIATTGTDLCECHNVIKCPNGRPHNRRLVAKRLQALLSASPHPRDVLYLRNDDLSQDGSAMVLRRYDLIPSHAVDDYNKTNFVTGRVLTQRDFIFPNFNLWRWRRRDATPPTPADGPCERLRVA